MTHFYFHFCSGDERASDELGLELASVEQAYLEAVDTARSMWAELLAARNNPMDCAFEVTDESGELFFRLPFTELVEACQPARAPGPPSELHRSIADSHLRAQTARETIRSSFDEVRQSLLESTALLGRLAQFERPRRGYLPNAPEARAVD